MTSRTYDELAKECLEGVLESLFPALERLEWSPEQLADHRQAALTETLTFAAARSGWHGDRLSGIDLSSVTADDLAALPTMTKGDLMGNWDDIVTDPSLDLVSARAHLDHVDAHGPAFLHDEYQVLTSGGSTGEPGVFCWARPELAEWASGVMRWSLAAGLGPPQRTAWIGARSLRHPSAALGVLSNGTSSTECLVPIDQPVTDVVDQLNAIQPDSLWVVCSMLPALVEARRSGSLRIDIDRITVGGDVLDPASVDAAEEVFGVRPIEGYPTTDVGHIGHQLPGEEGLYLHDDSLLIELVDEHDQPVADGALADHLLVTSLYHRTLPLIRYRIDDRVQLDPRPGRFPAYRRLARIDGRTDDLFRYGTVTVHPHVFRSALSRHGEIRDYLVCQTPNGAEVAVAARAGFDPVGLEHELTRALSRAGLTDPSVAVTVSDDLPRTAVGKRRRFVPSPGG
jgi:phenylacetate-CoA ligase